MSRRFVSQLGHQESVNQVFMVAEKQLRPNRNGNLYLQMDLSDRSGTIGARMWNASESQYRSFDNGDYVLVEGNTQLFQAMPTPKWRLGASRDLVLRPLLRCAKPQE